MRKTLGIAVVAATFGLAGAAFAAHAPYTGPGSHDGLPGNQGCDVLELPNQSFKNPGQMFRAIREAFDENPKERADYVSGATGLDLSVGDFIELRCNDPEA